VRRLLVLLVFAPVFAFGQPAASSLTGRVTSDGVPVAGVEILIASENLPGVRTAKTGTGGEYFLRSIPPGIYDVEFSRSGYQTVIKRAELQLAETTRLDTEMALSEVAETISVTTLMPSLLESPQLSTNFDAATVDRLPVGRSIRERLVFVPGLDPERLNSRIDELTLADTVGDAILESNAVTGGLSAEYDEPSLLTVTRSGANDLTGSVRATLTEGGRDLYEATIGGDLIEDRIWFFGAANDDETLAKLTAVVEDRHSIALAHHEDFSARYAGAIGDTTTIEALAHEEQWSLRGHAFVSSSGSHSVIAGVEDRGDIAYFANDVWRANEHWTASVGLRGDDRLEPRLGAVYDFRGDGEHRLSASWARYDVLDEAVLTYGWRFGVGGYARADYIHRASDDTLDLVQLHGSYDLFRMFRVGGNYTAQIGEASDPQRRANGWFWFEPELGDGVMTLSILQRYIGLDLESFFSTDLAAMYAYPVRSLTTFAKVDVINVFDRPLYAEDELWVERTWRGSVGIRF
jgi:hypothetical protein